MNRGERRVGGDRDQRIAALPSFEAFYRREARGVLAVALTATRRRWEAEEVVQEAFLRAYRDWESVGRMDRPEGWVRVVAMNLARGRWRRLRSEARALLRLVPRVEGPPADPVSARFWDAVRGLSHRQTQVVVLTYVEDLDSEAVGRVLGISPATVRVHLARAREKLAETLEAET